jgi:enoyl-CoA hydratase
MSTEVIRLTIRDSVASIVLNRPDVLNCINGQWLKEFNAILDRLDGSTEKCPSVVLISGEGRAFCSGLDLTALAMGQIDQDFFRTWEIALRKLETMDAIVVACVHSYCIGGGLQLALACDFRVAREDTKFAVTAVNEGIIPGLGMWRLARHAGLSRARQLALAGDMIDAETAKEWGLVEYVEPSRSFQARVTDVTRRLLIMPSDAKRFTKKLINLSFDTEWADAVGIFAQYQETALNSQQHREAMERYLASRSTKYNASHPTPNLTYPWVHYYVAHLRATSRRNRFS